MNTQKQIGLMIALVFIATASCAAYSVIDIPIRAEDQTDWHFTESVERGALLYANNCRTCHGIRGEGFVGPTLNKPEFKDQDPLVLAQNQAMILRTLQCGRAGTRMPAWLNTNGGSLNERQLEHLVNLLTAPAEEGHEDGTNFGWAEALHFAHNLNHETALVVGGDTLSSIGRSHDVGIAEVLALNPNITDPHAFLPEGSTVRLPASSEAPERDYEVETSRENVVRIVGAHFVDAMILADLNEIPFEFNEDDLVFTIGAKEGVSEAGVGLYPGAELQLPPGSVYVLRAGDTVDRVAELHNLDAGEIVDLNEDALTDEQADDTGAELNEKATLELPEGATYTVQEGDTQASIEEMHGLAEDALDGADLTPGATIELPEGATYLVQAEDTLALAAQLHGMEEAELAQLNDLEPGTPIRQEVTLALPDDAVYVVEGQSLEDIRETLGGVTAESLGQAQDPPVAADFVYAIGSPLHMPPDAFGSAPPDALNPGTACVEHAVSAAAFESIFGAGGPPEAPEDFSDQVEIQSNANDWTVVADGQAQPPNEGATKVEVGATVLFRNVVGFHTIDINDEQVVPEFTGTDEYEHTFEEAGTFEVTCEIHPDMTAWVFVEEAQ